MQKPIFFEHEIVNKGNMDFLTDSVEQTIGQNLTVFTNGEPGIVQGLSLGGTVGNGTYTVSAGFGYTSSGERLQLFSSTGVQIPSSGVQNIYAKLTTLNYDPETNLPALTQFNPETNSSEAVQQYNGITFSTTSGTDAIFLGTVTADEYNKYQSSDISSAQYLKLGGFFDLNSQTIDGFVISSGTIDSTAFKSGLTATIILNTGTHILSTASGSTNIGSVSNPISNVYSMTGTFHQINGMSPIIIESLQMKPSASIESASSLEKLSLDTAGRGLQVGGAVYTTGINAGTNGLTLYTQSGNINLQTASGSVNILNDVNITNVLTVSEQANFNGGLTIAGGGTLDFSDTNVILNQNNFSTKNLVFNSDFSMGLPTYYTGTSIFNQSGVSNFKSGLAVLSPWESRYAGALSPYNWNISGSSLRMTLGTAEYNGVNIGRNEVQTITTHAFYEGTPNTGTFYIQYTGISQALWPNGPAETGTSLALPFDITATGLQTVLGAFSNIGSGNVSVTGNYVNGWVVTFVSGLGFKNVPALNITGSTIASGVITTVTGVSCVDGITPTDYYSTFKEPSVYTGLPGLGTFARISGSVIIGSGVFSTEIQSAQPGKQYNLSLFYKNINTDKYLNVSAGIFDNAYGAGTGSTFTQITKTADTLDWQRLYTNLTSPITTGSSYLVFRLTPTGTNNVSPLFDLAGVQLTLGPNLVAYNNNSPSTFNMYEPSGITNPSQWTGAFSYDTTNNVTSNSVAGGIVQPLTLASGSFYSPGGLFNIDGSCILYKGKFGDGSRTGVHMWAYCELDGKAIASTFYRDPYSVFTGGNSSDASIIQYSPNKTMYIPRGYHTIGLKAKWTGGNGTNPNVVSVFISGSTSDVGIVAPRIDLTLLNS